MTSLFIVNRHGLVHALRSGQSCNAVRHAYTRKLVTRLQALVFKLPRCESLLATVVRLSAPRSGCVVSLSITLEYDTESGTWDAQARKDGLVDYDTGGAQPKSPEADLSPETRALVEQARAVAPLLRTEEFTVYTEGLCYSSVCTSLTNEEATERRNLMPSGTSIGWRIVDGPFRDGTPNGSPCEKKPATHRHLLFEC